MSYKNIVTGVETYYSDWLVSLRKINSEHITIIDFKNHQNLVDIIVKKNIDYIIPLSETDYLTIKKNFKIDPSIILYPTNETFEVLNNKLLFTKFMLEHFTTNIPTTYYLSNVKLLDLEYPVVSKPIFSTNGKGIEIFYTPDDFLRCKNKFIVQKFIEDNYEYGAFMLCVNGKIINYKIIKFRFNKYHIKKHNFPSNYENVTNIKIELFEQIIEKLNYSGGINIDFKIDESNDNTHIYIFEINPRFGGSAFSNNFICDLLSIKK